MITFTYEPISYLLSCGFDVLCYKHWQEAENNKDALPYDMDWEAYERLENDNSLRVIAVRHSGKLIGYAAVRIFKSLQSRNVTCAYIQGYYIEPEYRPKGAGVKLFRFIEAQLKNINVQNVSCEERHAVRDGKLAKFFRFLGYESGGRMWTKQLVRA